MATTQRTSVDPVLGFPEDPDLERERLLADVTARGLDPDAALHVVDELATSETPSADDYRAVDRRIASGYDVRETERILIDHDMSVTAHRGGRTAYGTEDDAPHGEVVTDAPSAAPPIAPTSF